jgi:superfamily I DNA/RNA helicase
VAVASQSIDMAGKRWANVEGLFETLKRREARDGRGAEGLASFLHTLTMDIDSGSDDPGDVVTLSTLHGSKGLEFPLVFLIGCEEGYLPHARTIDPKVTDAGEGGSADIEEERRLFYVGVTRARERLVLSRAKTRVVRGRAVPRTPSRFLLDVPADALEEVDVKEAAPTTQAEAAQSIGTLLAMLGPER